jgi:hypothetical protein
MGKIKVIAARLAGLVIVLGLSQLVQAQQANMWTPLGPAGGLPGGRFVHSAAYDPTTNRMIIFGGEYQDRNGTYYNDVWVLANADGLGGAPAWTQLAPSGIPPAPRFGSGAVYDPGSNRLIVFGGNIVDYPGITPTCASLLNAGTANDVWILTNANGSGGTPAWTQLIPAGAPPSPRRSAPVVYDAANNRMIVFGGSEACSVRNDVWVLSNANGLGVGTPTWAQLTPSGAPPAPRGELGNGGAYDSVNNRLIIFGGYRSVSSWNDVWVLSNANGLAGTPAWTQLNPAGGPPIGRWAHTVTYDAATNSLTVVGGVDSSTNFLNDVWRLSNANGLGGTPGWTQRTSLGGPFPRAGHSAVYHQAARRAVIFAGASCYPCPGLNDTWVLADVVPFAAFSAAVQINQASSSFSVTGGFTPGSGGSVVPLTQTVIFQVGRFMTTIPAGSFTQTATGSYTYSGIINGVPLNVTLQPSVGGYGLTFDAAGALGLPTSNPVTVGLTIGDNTGNIQVNAVFN